MFVSHDLWEAVCLNASVSESGNNSDESVTLKLIVSMK